MMGNKIKTLREIFANIAFALFQVLTFCISCLWLLGNGIAYRDMSCEQGLFEDQTSSVFELIIYIFLPILAINIAFIFQRQRRLLRSFIPILYFAFVPASLICSVYFSCADISHYGIFNEISTLCIALLFFLLYFVSSFYLFLEKYLKE